MLVSPSPLARSDDNIPTATVGVISKVNADGASCWVEWQSEPIRKTRHSIKGGASLVVAEKHMYNKSEELQSKLEVWWQQARLGGDDCRTCVCGRPVKKTEYFVCKPPAKLVFPCWPRRYSSCCRTCRGSSVLSASSDHTRSCTLRMERSQV